MGQKLGTRLRGLLLVIGTVIFGVVVGFLTNLVTGDDGRLWPFLLASVVGLVACSALLWLLEQHGGLAFGMDHRFERDRAKALGRVRAHVRDLLAESFAGVRPLDLALADRDGSPLPAAVSVADCFDESLLILGVAGAGKTTLLGELAQMLVNQAEQDPDHPVPVVIPLSAWRPKRLHRLLWRLTGFWPERHDMTGWVLHQMRVRYGIQERVGKAWLSGRLIALLLDGLDEVPASERPAVTKSLAELLGSAGAQPPMVVTCRSDAYAALPTGIEVGRVISVRPLTRAQIADYLADGGPGTMKLRAVLAEQDKLWDILTTPLWLRVAAVTGWEMPDGLPPDRIRQILMDNYLAELLSRRPAADRVQLVRGLAELARITVYRLEGGDQRQGIPFVRPMTAGVNHYLFPTLLCSVTATAVTVPLAAQFGLVAGLASAASCALVAWQVLATRFAIVSPDIIPAPRVTRRRVAGVATAVVLGVPMGLLANALAEPVAWFYDWGRPLWPFELFDIVLFLIGAWRAGIALLPVLFLNMWRISDLNADWVSSLAAGTGAGTVCVLIVVTLTGGPTPKEAPDQLYVRPLRRLLPEWALWTVVALAIAGPAWGGPFWAPLVGTAVGLVVGILPAAILTGLLHVPITTMRRWLGMWAGLFPPRWRRFQRDAIRHGLLVKEGRGYWFPHVLFVEHLSSIDPLVGLPPRTVEERREVDDHRRAAVERIAEHLTVIPPDSTVHSRLAEIDAGRRALWLPAHNDQLATALAGQLLNRARLDLEAPMPIPLELGDRRRHRGIQHPATRWDSRIRWVLKQAAARYDIDPGDLWRWLLDGHAALVLTGPRHRSTVDLLRRLRSTFPAAPLVVTLDPKDADQLTLPEAEGTENLAEHT